MDRIKLLLSKYLLNEATREEIQEMLQWLRENEHNEPVLQELWEQHPSLPAAPVADRERMWLQIAASTTMPVHTSTFIRRHWTAIAAAVILLVAGAVFLMVRSRHSPQAGPATASVREIAPGRNGAILTLADGTKLSLDSAGNGEIARQNGTRLLLQNSQLAYKGGDTVSEELAYNTMTTPKGRQFSLVLPDGSKVWLNAASSIHFPTQFTEHERRVEITGEAYFEIAKDKNRPFFVQGLNTEIQVLGTSFNINAYKDEEIVKTTLLEGSIATFAHYPGRPDEKIILSPGEEAQVRPDEKMVIDRHADTEQAVAWKNGIFNFQNAGLKEVMRQLARWYDLEIVYEKNVPDVRFGGEMSMNVPLSDLLKGLKDMEIHFRIEGNHKLIVMP